MRLIDADKLTEICRKGWKLYGREDEKLKHWVDEDDIRNQPTVEAIPVEWLKKWAEDNSNGEWSVEYRTVFNGILKDWEKEEKGDDVHQTEKCIKTVADDLDECVDNFLKRVYTDLLISWESTHKDATDNNIIPYEIQEINPDKER